MTGAQGAKKKGLDAGLSPGSKKEIQEWLGIEVFVDRGREEA